MLAATLILAFQPPELWETNVCCLLSLWYFVMAAQMVLDRVHSYTHTHTHTRQSHSLCHMLFMFFAIVSIFPPSSHFQFGCFFIDFSLYMLGSYIQSAINSSIEFYTAFKILSHLEFLYHSEDFNSLPSLSIISPFF